MLFNKLKLFTVKLNNFILCLIILVIIYSVVIHFNYESVPEDCFPKYLNKYLNIDENFVENSASLEVNALLTKLKTSNKEREVLNVEEYGPVSGETPFLVVRVHRDLARLQLLVASLAQTTGVDDLLLIFSHSYYDQKINHLIQQIDFCMVLQIFYLNSVQLNPDTFPGFDSEDSANGTNNGRSRRDPRLTEPKHHWWWTVNYVFDQLAWPEPHTEMVMFIDESSYVLPDLLFVFSSAKYAMSYFPDVDVISLGRGLLSESDYDRVTVEAWRAAHGNGLAFNRSTWQKISALGWHFCEYDDTSWSHSLLHLFGRLPGGRALAMATLAPRVLRAPGERALRRLCHLTMQHHLFPRIVRAVVLYGRQGKVLATPEAPPKGNGGWSDHRDVFQCYEVTIAEDNATTSVLEQV